MISRNEYLSFLLTDVARLLRQRFDRGLVAAGLGLTPGEARALAHVSNCPGYRQNVLAERMNVEPMTLVGFLDRLEAAGMIERLPDPTDRRAKLIYPKPAASQAVEQIMAIAAAAREPAMAGFAGEDLDRLRELLALMHNNLVAAVAAERDAPVPAV
jgi:DNA-binding MarR family transcriptional regulator